MKNYLSARALLSAGIIWLAATIVAAAEQPGNFRFPEGFESVQLGMSVSQLVNARNNVKPFGFFQEGATLDTSKPDQVLFEYLSKHTVFDTTLYRFEAGKLNTFLLAGKLSGENMARKTEAFLDMAISLWGKADEAHVVGIDDPKGAAPGAPALVWIRARTMIVAAWTSLDNQEKLKQGSVQLKILKCAEEDLADAMQRRNVLIRLFTLPDIASDEQIRILGLIGDRLREHN